MSRGPRLVLVGPPGAPGLAVGRLLAERWQVPLVDTDAEIASAAGRSVADLLLDDGEQAYRVLESRAVDAALHADGVVVLGSGAVGDPLTRERLVARVRAGGAVVLVDLPAGESARAAGLNAAGAAGLGPTRARWRALYDERHALLEQVAGARVAVGDHTPAQLADEVAALVDGSVPG